MPGQALSRINVPRRRLLGLTSGGYGYQARDAEPVQDQDDQRVGAHAENLAARSEDQSGHVDRGQQNAQASQVDVTVLGERQNRPAGQQAGQQEQHRQEGVAAKDVADRNW